MQCCEFDAFGYVSLSSVAPVKHGDQQQRGSRCRMVSYNTLSLEYKSVMLSMAGEMTDAIEVLPLWSWWVEDGSPGKTRCA